MAKPSLIQLKKNKSLKLFDTLPDNQQLSIINLAIEKRGCQANESTNNVTENGEND